MRTAAHGAWGFLLCLECVLAFPALAAGPGGTRGNCGPPRPAKSSVFFPCASARARDPGNGWAAAGRGDRRLQQDAFRFRPSLDREKPKAGGRGKGPAIPRQTDLRSPRGRKQIFLAPPIRGVLLGIRPVPLHTIYVLIIFQKGFFGPSYEFPAQKGGGTFRGRLTGR